MLSQNVGHAEKKLVTWNQEILMNIALLAGHKGTLGYAKI